MPYIALCKILKEKYGYSLKKSLDLVKVHKGLIDLCNKAQVKDKYIAIGIHERETGKRLMLA